jgi:SAM-dependent methyltransferase
VLVPAPMTNIATNSADCYWSAKREYAPNWYSFCAGLIARRISGDPNLPATPWALRTFWKGPVAHLLEIGCLSGDKLAGMVKSGLAVRGSGIDIAAGAIQRGRETHGDAISLMVGDLNKPELPHSAYDAISSNGVLHHIANLEVCCQELYDALVPGGILIASEFTGPQRYAYSKREIAAINEGVAMLPPDLQEPFDPAQMAGKLAADPSESIRTRDIGTVLAATFDDVIVRPYGGNVLMRALRAKFFAGFDPDNPEHTAGVDRLIAWDESVSTSMPSHHHVYVARKLRHPAI